jgi:hypothetical protein
MIMNFQLQHTEHSAKALSEIRALAEASGASVRDICSTRTEAISMSRKAVEVVSLPGINVVILHAHGIGAETRVPVDGAQGEDGSAGGPGRDGSNGQNGTIAALDGTDGADGDDGEEENVICT